MKGEIIERDGKLYVLYSHTLDNEPKLRSMGWLVNQTKSNPYNGGRPSAGDSCQSNIDDWWTCWREGHGSTGSVFIPGRQEAAFVEVTDVPQPKVRKGTELFWRDGAWRKYTKKDGWVAV